MKVSRKAINSRNTKKFLCVLMALVIMLVPMGVVFGSAESNTFRVSTSEEFVNAVKEINAGADDAEYVIEMLNNITVTGRTDGGSGALLKFKRGTTTIYGNSFVLDSDYVVSDSLICAAENSVVNLGSADELEKSKLFFNATDAALSRNGDLLTVTDSATANIYEGVVFQNNSPMGRPGGAISVGEMESNTSAKLNMYGGIIRNCQDMWASYGGAVFVGANATFNMYGGAIENNKAGQYGGGICNAGGTFNMTGGVIQNNKANAAADDIFSQGTTNITVAASKNNGFGALTSTSKQIKGWFEDGNNKNGSRWDVNDYCVEITAEDASAAEVVALKAAHSAGAEVTFNTNSGVWKDTSDKFTENADNTYSESLNSGATATQPTNPTKTDYTFLGWFTEDGTEYNFDSEVNEDITLYAKWEYNGYKNSVTLDKIYQIADGYNKSGSTIDPDGKLIEDITLAIETYNSFNREVGKTSIPAFAEAEYKFTTGIGTDEIQIALPDFNGYGVGDYWYKVTELKGSTAGVTYDTNKYYMHIVVTHEDALNPDSSGISQITFHKNAPNEDGTYTNKASDKATGFTNTYAAGSLSVTTDIKGNFADRTKTFDVKVTFNAPENKTVTGDIYFGDDTVAVEGGWNTSKTVTITLGLGDTITFKNIPDGVTYTVAENDYSADGYNNPVYTFDNAQENGDTANAGDEWALNNAQGTISDDADTVTIMNEKNVTIDVGVFLENAPFVALILLVVAVAVVMIITRRRRIIDAE